MLRFKDFLIESSAMFTRMTRREWLKYGTKRTDALKDAIANDNPVPDVNGKNIVILNTKDNLKAIDDFVKSKDPVFYVTIKGNKTVESNLIGKSPLFGGKGQGAGATGATAKGEALQCLYLAAMLKEGISKEFAHYTPQLLKKYASSIDTDKSFDEMMSSAAEWHYSAYVSAKYLIEKGYVLKDHVLHRGSRSMNAIYAMKKKAFKADGKPNLNDDKWNPGDIWAIRKGVNLNTLLDASSVMSLNAGLKKAFLNRDIVGISLKQINNLKKKAKHKDYNLEGVELGVHRYTRSILKSDRAGSTFWSFKGGYIYFDSNRRMDVRAPNALGALNVEIQGTGARGGRAGYGSIEYAAKKYLRKTLKTNAQLKSEASAMVNGGNEAKAKELWKKVNHIHNDVKWDDFWNEMKTQGRDRIHANLGATEIIYAVDKASKKQAEQFVSYLVNMAGSKTSDSSVYVKVEAS